MSKWMKSERIKSLFFKNGWPVTCLWLFIVEFKFGREKVRTMFLVPLEVGDSSRIKKIWSNSGENIWSNSGENYGWGCPWKCHHSTSGVWIWVTKSCFSSVLVRVRHWRGETYQFLWKRESEQILTVVSTETTLFSNPSGWVILLLWFHPSRHNWLSQMDTWLRRNQSVHL